MPAPTQHMINTLGPRFQYYYLANYKISDAAGESNVSERLLPLLVLLASAAAMEMLMVRGVAKPVTMKAGVGRISKAEPSVVRDALMDAAKQMSTGL